MKLPYVHSYRDRHGKLRHYFYLRRPGWSKIPLPGEPGSDEFMAAYAAAKAGMALDRPSAPERFGPGSVSGAIAAYMTDAAFLALRSSTQQKRRRHLERFRKTFGDVQIHEFKQADIARVLGRLRPFAARDFLKTLRGMFRFAVAIGLRKDDPTEGIKPVRANAGTIHTWTEDEIAGFEARHPVGTRERLALALMLYTAARRGDAILLGPQHIRDGQLRYRQQKTGRALVIPVHPKLAEVLAATPTGHLSFLVTSRGKPYTATPFSTWFRKACDAAGLPHCSAHGLRKACARRLAELGCSTHEIAAITGHKTLAEIQRYTAAAEQERLAERAFKRT